MQHDHFQKKVRKERSDSVGRAFRDLGLKGLLVRDQTDLESQCCVLGPDTFSADQ